jgi:hypothetical protein
VKTIFRLTAAALAVGALAGCDHGLSVSGSSSTTAGTSSEIKSSTETSVAAKKTLTATVKMSGATLANAALTGLAREQLDPPGADPGMQNLQWVLLMHKSYSAGPQAVADSLLKPQEAVAKYLHKPLSAVVRVIPPFAQAKLDTQSAYLHAAAALAVAQVAAPIQGWPFNCFGCSRETAWARAKAHEIAFVNLLETQLLGEVQGATLADPRAAKVKLAAALAAMPDSTIEAAWVQAGQGLSGQLNLDFSGSQPAPVHFILGSNDVQGGPAGWKLAQNGTIWFGDGKVSGREIGLELASAIDTSASTSAGTNQAGTSGTETGSEGSAGVK